MAHAASVGDRAPLDAPGDARLEPHRQSRGVCARADRSFLNLVHVVQEDYPDIASCTLDWWYPSPWHITDEEGGTK